MPATVPDPAADDTTDQRSAASAPATSCASCGAPQAKVWSTPDGPARLCPVCATLNGIGCP